MYQYVPVYEVGINVFYQYFIYSLNTDYGICFIQLPGKWGMK